MKKRILVVEDDPSLGEGLQLNLELEGWEAVVCRSAEEAEPVWRAGGVDLVILDIGLPGEDGLAFCRRIRSAGDRVPLLFLTARDQSRDRVLGLDEGGDDYMTKPFHLGELLARIKGLFRREEWARDRSVPDEITIGPSRVNLRLRTLENASGVHELREKEAMILRLLAEKRGEPVDRHTILNRIWGFDAFPTTRTVDNFIVNLRKLLEEDPADPRHLVTVRGVGYRLVP
jgi:two-component system alkaline phosphatase synthesis response regulator PhoP